MPQPAPAQALRIRPAHPDDSGAIWSMLEPAIREAETFALPPDMQRDPALAYWMAPDHHIFIAEADGKIVGTYFVRPNQRGGGAHVANAGYLTATESRGRGIARAMCEHSLQQARALGFTAMQFNFVVSTNERAVRAWHSLGFNTVGRLPGAFIHPRLGPVDALVMYRAL
jgi:GNAT superfamily N-acetyltransferase